MASPKKKLDVGKYDMRGKRQHTVYSQIVLMKQPGPAPQYYMQVSNISRKNPSFPHFAPRKQILCMSTWQTARHARKQKRCQH